MATSVDAKLLKQTKFPPEFSRKVDMNKVNIEVMKKCVAKPWVSYLDDVIVRVGPELTLDDCCRWIAGKISEILGNEDDVVIELCFNLLEGSRFVCATLLLAGLLSFGVDEKSSLLTGLPFALSSPILNPFRFNSPGSWIEIRPSSARSCGRSV